VLITIIQNGITEKYLMDSEFEHMMDKEEAIREKAKQLHSKYNYTLHEAYAIAKKIINNR